jgi:hypothetical protein
MDLHSLSLWLPFIGACCVGLSQQFGFGSGWGGVITFKSNWWRYLNGVGWIFLVVGFFVQLWVN